MARWLTPFASLILCLSACSPSGPVKDGPDGSGEPTPALWRLADGDTTVFVFGTVHLLPPDMTWRTPALTAALSGAQALYLEADTELPPARLGEIVRQTAQLEPGRRLQDLLDETQQAALRKAAARYGLPEQMFEAMRPWYASVVLSDAAIRGTGMSLDAGADSQLRAEARRQGIGLRFLETVEGQLSAYTRLPEAVQVRLLEATLADIDEAGEVLTEMVKAWRSGDDDRLTQLAIGEQLIRLPEVYDMVMVQRNAAWAPQIGSLLRDEKGTFLIAVGAAHLLGPDSLLRMMETLGYPPERIR